MGNASRAKRQGMKQLFLSGLNGLLHYIMPRIDTPRKYNYVSASYS